MKRGFQNDIVVALVFHRKKQMENNWGKKSRDDVIFWPDLALCHYAKKTQEFLTENGLFFVPQDHNPPNAPQI